MVRVRGLWPWTHWVGNVGILKHDCNMENTFLLTLSNNLNNLYLVRLTFTFLTVLR